jgi:hypothetical protein
MKSLITIVVVGALISMTSCSKTGHNYIVLIDNSRSIPERVWDKYIAVLQNTILNNLHPGDRLTVQFIDRCSLSKAERIFTLNLADMNFTNSTDGKIYENDSIQARITRFLRDSIEPECKLTLTTKREERIECGSFSDILNAINGSQSLLNDDTAISKATEIANSATATTAYKYKNCLLIFSDMINEDAEHHFDFTNMETLTDADITKEIRVLQSLHEIPNLQGVQVFIYGATASNETGKDSNKQIENIRAFWQQYFDCAHAEIKAYGYDTENEIKQYTCNATSN